jgi:hypothetical protein
MKNYLQNEDKERTKVSLKPVNCNLYFHWIKWMLYSIHLNFKPFAGISGFICSNYSLRCKHAERFYVEIACTIILVLILFLPTLFFLLFSFSLISYRPWHGICLSLIIIIHTPKVFLHRTDVCLKLCIGFFLPYFSFFTYF